MQIRLNDRVLEQARAKKGERVELWDTEVRGLGLRVDAIGRKIFNFKYQFRGDQGRVSLGEWPSMSLAEARVQGRKLRNDLDEGNLPKLEEREVKKESTFKDFSQVFLDRYVFPRLKATSAESYEYILRRVLVPAFGPYSVADITPEEVEDFHQAMADRPRLANLALSVLSRLFTQAARWGYRQMGDNPAQYVERFEEERRNRHLSDEELVKLWNHLDMLERMGQETVWVCRAIKLALLTGLRRTELSVLRWDTVHLDDRTIVLRPTRTARKGPERQVALSDLAVDVLRSLPRVPYNSLLFPGRRPGTQASLDDTWLRIRKDLGMEDVRFHDLRQTYGSLAAAGAQPLSHIAGQMGIGAEAVGKNQQPQKAPAGDGLLGVADTVGHRVQALLRASAPAN